MSQKNIVITILGVSVLVAGLIIWAGKTPAPVSDPTAGEAGNWEDNLTPVNSIYYQFQNNHLHGMGYDSVNNQLLLATHYGLFVLENGQLYQLGNNRDDFMGFSLNQHNPDIIYTSGHPRMGGNLGVLKSEDRGLTFEHIFSNIGLGQVDFHSMTLSYVDQNILYGFFQGYLYRTLDGGDSWEFARAMVSNRGNEGLLQQGSCWGVPCLATDTENRATVYAGTLGGILISRDLGETWDIVESDSGAVASLALNPNDNQNIFAFTENYGVAESVDGGKTWESRNNGLQFGAQDIVFAFSFDTNNPNIIFLATTGNQVYRTENGGESWEKIL